MVFFVETMDNLFAIEIFPASTKSNHSCFESYNSLLPLNKSTKNFQCLFGFFERNSIINHNVFDDVTAVALLTFRKAHGIVCDGTVR